MLLFVVAFQSSPIPELTRFPFDHNQESNHKKLKYYEDTIIQLNARQKVVLTSLRNERLNASSLNQTVPSKQISSLPKSFYVQNQTNLLKPTKGAYLSPEKQQLLRPPFNGKKMLIPVSAAAATSKKINQQILVVSTPGGGARLAAATSPTGNRPALAKSSLVNSNGFSTSSAGNSLLHPSSSIAKSKQYNNFTITNTTKAITTPLSNSLSLKNSRIIPNDKTTAAAAASTNSLLPASNAGAMKRKMPGGLPSVRPQEQQPVSRMDNKIDETKLKEQFMLKLGLVTKQALSEIQNKKSERKRRTTANPQFSTAAITAKRIEAQENAAKKAIKKREREDNLLNSNTSNKRAFLNANSRTNKAISGGKPERKAPKSGTGKQLSQNSNEIKISRNCFVCDEVCDSDLDEIMFCGDCHCLFHVSLVATFVCCYKRTAVTNLAFSIPKKQVTCSSTIDRIKKTMGVPCPKCERKRSLADELPFNENSNESGETLKQKAALDSSNSNSSSVVSGKALCRRKIDKSKNVKFSKTNKYTNPSNKSDLAKPGFKAPNESSKTEPKSDDERYRCLVKYELLDRQVRDFRVKLALLKDKVYISKENRREMLVKKENSKRSIDLIINLVKKIQEQEDIETKENQENQCELVNVPNSKDTTVESTEPILVLNEIIASNKVEPADDKVNDFRVTEEEANEAANNLNALSEICSQISSGELITSSSAKVPLSEVSSLNDLHQEIDLVQEAPNDLLATAAVETNGDEPPPASQTATAILLDEQPPVMVAEIELDSQNNVEPANDDEPPNKRARLSPILECKVYSAVAASDDLDDEVSAAIASIQD